MAGCIKRERLVVSSAQIDPGLTGVGGSPFLGDISSTGIVVPATPTVSQDTRYLFRIFSVGLGPNQTAFIQSLIYYLWIGTDKTQPTGVCHFEQIVTTPGWHLPDGNASFHLRRLNYSQQGRLSPFAAPPPIGAPGTLITSSNGLTPGLLGNYVGAIYTPLNAGMPYGEGIAGLGTTRDVRFPPNQSHNQDLGLQVTGPGFIEGFASIWQSDPSTRINWAGSKDITDGLCPEDRFLVRFDQCRYWRVGGQMIVDLCTWDEEGWCPEKTCEGYRNPNLPCPHRPVGLRELIRP